MSPDTLRAARPRLREGVRLGPAVRSGPTLVHSVKEPVSGRYFQIGPSEFFIMARLDGVTTLAEIDRQYAVEFRRRLTDDHWAHILGTLGRRGLLSGSEPPQAPAPEQRRRSLLYVRLPVVAPERWLGRLEPRLRPLFSPYAVVPLLVAVVGMEIAVLARAGDLWGATTRLGEGRPLVLAAVLLGVWLTVAVHEVAHGLTGTHFGGTATEIGVVWRFPMLAPYCRVNDIVFMARRHRVYVAFSGMFAGLVVLLPVAIAWPLLGGTAADAAGSALLLGSLSGLINLLPFFRLDGYAMLNHALGMRDLQGESLAYVRGLLRRDRALPPYPRGQTRIYVIYVTCAALACVAWVCWIVLWTVRSFGH
ncbi:M50 family metallopeptidase [Microbispora sp. CA-135349]|uniref:M50 family metallopeptidase n=1 Tax=Microbispora sp. CA-135349 TaxID=3239953 RepID=UPI003D91DF05